MAHVATNAKHGLFLHEQLIYVHTEKYTDEASTIAFDEDIMENNYMFVMEFKLYKSLDIPTILFFISGAKSKNNLIGYVAF